MYTILKIKIKIKIVINFLIKKITHPNRHFQTPTEKFRFHGQDALPRSRSPDHFLVHMKHVSDENDGLNILTTDLVFDGMKLSQFLGKIFWVIYKKYFTDLF